MILDTLLYDDERKIVGQVSLLVRPGPTKWAPMPEEDSSDRRNRVLVNTTGVQEYLNALVENLGSCTSFDPNTSLQDLGIDSVGAMQFVNEVRHRYGISLSPRFILTYPTTGKMAARIMEILREEMQQRDD